ncbi:unnamed protein product [Psylliodes chrysocephalus]|uniref:Uncharacterized protein n=1 Tax=Psylliodes chrysocephalus TaxID=3402493 RepID=A0A9P0GK25_9CUCU|nr:unnamed protein product [Psylliodes chrysocephala]
MESDSSNCESVQVISSTKKRPKHGRLTDVNKKLKVQSHEIGKECDCKRLQCSKKIPAEGKRDIIKNFNLLESTDKQNSYLCGLISIVPVKNRRSRVDEENARLRDVVALYKIRYLHENKLNELEICRDEFIALHGITKRRIEYLLTSLKNTGISPIDKRGKHSKRPLKLSDVTLTFPIRGHSYMENDKNMGIINQKARVKTVKELCDLVQSSRKKPSPFVVEHLSEDNQHIFQQWTEHLNKFYKKKASFPIQSIRQFEVSKEHPRLIKYRDTYNGTWISAVVMDRKSVVLKNLETNNQFLLPEISYTGPIPISAEKFANLQSLKKFCGKEAQDYFTSLVHN